VSFFDAVRKRLFLVALWMKWTDIWLIFWNFFRTNERLFLLLHLFLGVKMKKISDNFIASRKLLSLLASSADY